MSKVHEVLLVSNIVMFLMNSILIMFKICIAVVPASKAIIFKKTPFKVYKCS